MFRPPEYIDFAKRHRITTAVVVPSVVRQLLAVDTGAQPLLDMQAFFCTGAPLYADEKRDVLARLTPNFRERYGTAETLAISVLRPEDFAERAESVGQPHSLVEVEIVDEHDRALSAGAVGRLRIRGPGLASPLPDQDSATNFRDRWYYPGEIASVDDAGFIFLQGRLSDVIMRSGTKIYPAEVEKALLEHPEVLQAAVLGHRGTSNEEMVIAFVVLRTKQPLGVLLAHCRLRLTPHKIPRHFHIVDELPRNTAGKIDKLALARSLADGPAA